jgi:hypothetical protein
MSFADWIAIITGFFVNAGFIFLIFFLWNSFKKDSSNEEIIIENKQNQNLPRKPKIIQYKQQENSYKEQNEQPENLYKEQNELEGKVTEIYN